MITRVASLALFQLLGLIHIDDQGPEFRFHGLKIFVEDLEESRQFYSEELGFRPNADSKTIYETGAWPLYLEEAESSVSTKYPTESRTGLTVQTFKLLPRMERLRSQNVPFYDSLLARNGVGISIPFKDPSGNAINLMEVQVRPVPLFEGVKIYNCGVTVPDMDTAIDFYVGLLGFNEWSRNYLPAALPLKHGDNSFAFMIHYKEGITKSSVDYGEQPHFSLILETESLEKAKQFLSDEAIEFFEKESKIIARDPFGNYFEIIPSS